MVPLSERGWLRPYSDTVDDSSIVGHFTAITLQVSPVYPKQIARAGVVSWNEELRTAVNYVCTASRRSKALSCWRTARSITHRVGRLALLTSFNTAKVLSSIVAAFRLRVSRNITRKLLSFFCSLFFPSFFSLSLSFFFFYLT